LSAVAIACAASFAFADPLPYLSPESPPSFGDLFDANPLVAVFTARGARDPAPDVRFFAEPQFDLASGADSAPRESASAPFAAAPAQAAAATDNLQPVAYDPTVGPSLSPMQSALQAALWRLVAHDAKRNPLGSGDWRAARGAIAAFYATRAYTPIWVSETGLTEAGRAALGQLKRASDDGLNLSAFALPHDLGSGLDPDAIAEAETTIASAVVAYAQQASGSRVPPVHVSGLIFATPSIVAPALLWLKPPGRGIQPGGSPTSTRRRKATARCATNSSASRIRASPNDGSVFSAPTLIPIRCLIFRKRGLRSERNGPLTLTFIKPQSAEHPQAPMRASGRRSLPTWRCGAGSRATWASGGSRSISRISRSWCWRATGSFIRRAWSLAKPETPTPIFSDVMRYVLINPSWQVPDSIIRKEMASKLGALSRRGYEVKTVGGRLTVRQLPGDDNALGRFAFMFPNDHAIYLHDTPSKDLFDEETRAFSHGCIRVEDPQSLAVLVLGGESTGWTDERIEAVIGGKERTVFLARPLPIHIEYFTDFVDEFGEIKERPDVYGLIRKVEVILARTSQD
jgi:hypothetical protein